MGGFVVETGQKQAAAQDGMARGASASAVV